MLERENQKLKEKIEALEYLLDQKEDKIEKLEKEVEESPDRREFAPSTSGSVYKTPVKPEVSSQQSQNTNQRNMDAYRIDLLKERIKEAVSDLRVKRQRRKHKAYLMVDRNRVGLYAGYTVQEIKRRLWGHATPTSQISSKELKEWIETLEYLEAFVIFEGEAEEAALVEALLISLADELGFDLLNRKQERSKLDTPTKLIGLDDDEEISIIIKELPIEKDAPGHEQLVADVRLMVQEAMKQRSVRHYRNSKSIDARARVIDRNKRHASVSFLCCIYL
jgi:hypothetical protein